MEKNNWIFARKDDGYLALRSQNPYFWTNEDVSLRGHSRKQSPAKQDTLNSGRSPRRQSSAARNDMENEIIVDESQNIWICQLGRKADDGAFEQFIESICSAELAFSGMNVEFQSPGNGLVRFGWVGPFSVDGIEIQLHDYPRYDNPYSQIELGSHVIRIAAGEDKLVLNWEMGEGGTGAD